MDNLKYRAYNYFKSNFDLHESSNGWYRLINPFTVKSDTSMGVNFEYNTVKCHRTGYKVSIIKFISDYEGIIYTDVYKYLMDNYEEIHYSNVLIPIQTVEHIDLPEYWEPLYADNSMSIRACNYLINRNIDIDIATRLGFGVCTDGDYFGYLIVPFKQDNVLKYYIGRNILGGTLRYKNPKKSLVGIGKSELFFNQDALKLYDTVYLLEGWSDAITLGDNGISSQGWSLSTNQKSILAKSNIKELIIVPDKGFYREAVLTAWDLYEISNFTISIVSLENFSNGKDVNEIGKDLILKELQNREQFSLNLLQKIL